MHWRGIHHSHLRDPRVQPRRTLRNLIDLTKSPGERSAWIVDGMKRKDLAIRTVQMHPVRTVIIVNQHRRGADDHIVRVGYPRPSRSVACLALLLTCSFLFGAARWVAGGGWLTATVTATWADGGVRRRPAREIEGYPR